ncbi:type IV toxin-antitoxin system AbiEi family antitoxin domain-containing protein [Iamia sp.]|uniref:type IV toxin-antitoxin system AbiEi family antitoxin domain-containing protein n=1 Tax=Iamia sp. TaxID=2722710 RepID=UPI002C2209F8|nr:type IV toxin-antitoxin system AbiEi family antitoxin domain-containing protein [Iamia sp.]HXH58363.1 type IV toxin-antitoxin system AbiEi family antitoxin domain-containing protein [Iamia sp.]
MSAELLSLAAAHHGVFTHAQAASRGVDPSRLRRWEKAGWVERVGPGVYRVAGAPASWREALAAAVLSVSGALASHRAAAALHGLDGIRPGRIELVVPRWSRRHRAGLVVHESTDLRPVDSGEVDGIPCTTLVRTLVDLPAVVHEFRAGQALDSAARRDRSVLSRVSARHLEVARRGRDGTVALRSLLAERGIGDRIPDSGFERMALRLIENSALPRPVLQHMVRDGDFLCYLDLAWPHQLVAMECDSLEHHFGARAHQWDRERRRHLTRLGWTVLEFTYQDVAHGGGGVVLRDLTHHLL